MPQTTGSAAFKLVRLEGFSAPLLARHFENGRSSASRSTLEAELAAHDWDAAPCFVITRLRSDGPPTTPTTPAPEQVPGFGDDFPWAMRAALRVVGAFQRARQRRALSLLDPRLLDDIGVTPEQAQAEARKPPWRS